MRGRSTADVSPAYVAILPRPVYKSSFWDSKEVYEMSQNRWEASGDVAVATEASMRVALNIAVRRTRSLRSQCRRLREEKSLDVLIVIVVTTSSSRITD